MPESLRTGGLQSLAVETQRKSSFHVYLFFNLYCCKYYMCSPRPPLIPAALELFLNRVAPLAFHHVHAIFCLLFMFIS